MTGLTLERLFADHDGKVSDKWHLYVQKYEAIFAAYRERQIRLLEIGIQNGGSLEIWAKYFPHAQVIVGCDVEPGCSHLTYVDPRIAVVVGDANSDSTAKAILQKAADFDVIIDDGSHRSGDIVDSFARYFPYLQDGGAFIVEDLHCSYWQEFDGGLFHPLSSIAFFKYFADAVNHEHWGVEKRRVTLFNRFCQRYGVRLNEDVLAHIHSVEFINSMCVIRKMAPLRNTLGKRVIAGYEEPVVTGHLALRGSLQVPPNQTSNESTTGSMLLENEVGIRKTSQVAGAHVGLDRLAMAECAAEADDAKPAIVAIIPLYNGARFIERAIWSVLNQSLKPTEFIVVDDGSTDEGPAIVRRMAVEHSITLLHKPNGGQSSARNLGVMHSTAPLIAFLDQDDAWYSNHLERLVGSYTEKRSIPLGWVYSNLDEIDESGCLVSRNFLDTITNEHPKRHLTGCLCQDMFILPSATLVARNAFEFVGGFDERLSGYEDDDLFLRIFRAGYDNVYLNEPLSQWRIYATSTSYSPRMAKSRMIYAHKLFAAYPNDPERNRYFSRDLIAPRFYHNLAGEYLSALKNRNRNAWARATSDLAQIAPHLCWRWRFLVRLLMLCVRNYPTARIVYTLRAVLRPLAA